jgi:predicted Zn-dependent peptidase
VPAEFAISSFTHTASTRQAVELALATLDTLKAEGATERSLDSARSYILGQYPLAFETSADWAAALAELDLYGLPDSYIDGFAEALRQVDAPQSRQVVADAYPDSQDVDIVLIGDASQIRLDASRWGAVQEMPLAAPVFQPAAC